MEEELAYSVLEFVAEIPRGKVVTYGQIANMIGYPKYSRLVGRILSHAEYYGEYPCHRVVGHDGRVASHFSNQRQLLESEGVTFLSDGKVNMMKHQCVFKE
ncbi:MAG TPA: methylated-DNA--[protein]-cysteine S-methyltransferase [Candidatus Scybalousia intestinigallinarum]|nr:methylated-DNA--[protein]-cysteine S-methyltransferase [Candidatus Scybalousia intestinigallinarum]